MGADDRELDVRRISHAATLAIGRGNDKGRFRGPCLS